MQRFFTEEDEQLIEYLRERIVSLEGPQESDILFPFSLDPESNSVKTQFNGPGGAFIYISTPIGDKWEIIKKLKEVLTGVV